jgi:hypothetical protein
LGYNGHITGNNGIVLVNEIWETMMEHVETMIIIRLQWNSNHGNILPGNQLTMGIYNYTMAIYRDTMCIYNIIYSMVYIYMYFGYENGNIMELWPAKNHCWG